MAMTDEQEKKDLKKRISHILFSEALKYFKEIAQEIRLIEAAEAPPSFT